LALFRNVTHKAERGEGDDDGELEKWLDPEKD
jgi:hypothetical protein